MIRILIVGGTGFIGRHIAGALRARGHSVVAASRAAVDLARDSEATLRDKLATFDVVINCAGLVRDAGANSMSAVHADGACNLFRAAISAGVERLIHVSALGVSAEGETGYQRTKSVAEDDLEALDPLGEKIDWRILRPSLVVGRGGASTAWLSAAAMLPRLPRLGHGDWRFQPVHVSDLAELAARLAEGGESPRRIDVVGPRSMNTDELLLTLRDWLGLRPAPFFRIPQRLFLFAAAIGGRVSTGPLNREVVKLLEKGNVADLAGMTTALGRAPRALRDALALQPASDADRVAARFFFLRPLPRWSLGLLWIATGLLSLGLYPIEKSQALVSQIGLSGALGDAAIYGGGALDLLLGALLLLRWRPPLVGLAQLASMTLFTALATRLPAECWLHPFAPLLKNLPVAALILLMIAMEI
ncbi:SDR family oxidoreductase [Methylocystis parvus]|uniref:SDR family oxidoreductase n=1 Tax=Methylocystis parvus TaxID=134 RepID=A0A6B8M5M1_9HYPH|nr:SDR family oxidoreductase [Methylocystis parvus]QGM97738.1 SDR family oxidoreductase [Methylocystis parvus]WBK01959.1 SDR family oxidoreductase [Methylocystis parvus OBBP]